MLKKSIHFFLLLAMLAGLFSLNPATPARAATLTVDNLTDGNDGSCMDGDCSLREAIAAANDNDTITFSVTGTIILTSALTVDKNLTITGPGSSQLTLDGNDQYQIFILNNNFPTHTINISGMTMTRGYADPNVVCGGGAIRSWAFLTMNDVVITDNHAPANIGSCQYPRGGGILFFDGVGSLTLTNSTINNNSAAWGGGGIQFNSTTGNFSLDNVIVENNQSTESDGGGVLISNALATVNISNSTITNNDAIGSGAEGGGLYILTFPITTPIVTITNSTISLNSAPDGGGIYTFDTIVNITNSTIADNSATNDGGGIYNYNGTINIDSSTLEGNSVTGSTTSYGGGIFNLGNTDTSSITVVNSTLTGNSSTIGQGGAIYNQASGGTVNDIATVDIYNTTIVGNSANGSLGGGGLVAGTAGGSEVSTINLFNSIVYGNTLTTGTNGENCATVNDSTITTNKNNLLQNLANDCSPGVNDVVSELKTSAIVNTLASNGGATQTMSLPSGSPATNAGDDVICATAPVNNTSQNGVTRPQYAHCDIGAYEYPNYGPTSLVNSVLPTSRTPMVGNTVTIFNTVLNAGSETASAVTLSMNPAPAGTFAYNQTDCNTNAIIGAPNAPVDIAPGGVACYVLSFTPSAAFSATQVHIQAQASNASATSLLPGINTWLLRSTASQGPDIIALTTTTDFHQVACSGANAFAVALSNVGAATSGDITVSANTGSASLPISISIQETDPGTGSIIGDHILNNLGAGENRTVAVFVSFHGCVAFDPAAHRIFVVFRDASNNVVGSTSTAISTNR